MIKQKDIYPMICEPNMPKRYFIEMKLVIKLREQLKSRARDINKFEGFVTIADIDDVFGVEAKK